MPDGPISFQQEAFLQIDRIERSMELLKDQLRSADEFLLLAQARVQDLMEKNGPGIPRIVLESQLPQTIGVNAAWVDGQFVIMVTHRGGEAEAFLPPQQSMEIEVNK
jgi:hypothetical protein